jgi:hypothetical protein
LVRALEDCATVEFIPQQQLLSGNLVPYLTRLLNKKKNWPTVPLDGADVAAGEDFAIDRSLNLSTDPVLTGLYQSTRLEA